MIDLSLLESRLNSDLKLREQFLNNPTSVLRTQGFVLSPVQENRLRAAVAKIRVSGPGKVVFDFSSKSANQE